MPIRRTLLPLPLAMVVIGSCLMAMALGVRAMVDRTSACCPCSAAQVTVVPQAIRGDLGFPRLCPANVICVP